MSWRHYSLVVLLSFLPLMWSACANVVDTGLDQSVSAIEFRQLLDRYRGDPDLVVLDIRTPMEFQTGHIEGAVLLDYYAVNFVERLKALDRDKTYLIYCRSGNRSAKSLAIFNQLGFKRALHLQTGIRGWYQAQYPTVKSRM